MPTGYTAKLYEGEQSWEEFAWGCARAFGALVTMRDDGADAPIPDEFAPSDYHEKALAEAQARVAELGALTMERARMEADADYMGALSRHTKTLADHREKRKRYAAMLKLAEAWEPPTADHVRFKEFMCEQLRESIDFDTNNDYLTTPQRATPLEWLEREQESAHRDVGYHAAEHAKEVERAITRTAWVQALRGSLTPEPVAA